MSTTVRNLSPQPLWNNFADLNAVPRPSKKEERVIAFMKKFGEDLGLETIVDHIGNVIIKKLATAGKEDRPIVALQSHLDMVHQKNADTDFDFDKQGIEMWVDGDWVRARGTTLGADNGLGVAAIMTLLAADDIPHPPLEALFTIDEETGMTGAMELKGGLLDAKYMLNLDTEDDRELTIGCAGGVDVTATGSYLQSPCPNNMTTYEVSIKGLTGGHSGMDIHRGRGNANKLMNRLLLQAESGYGLRVGKIDGGGLRNAIPRESFAVVAVQTGKSAQFEQFLKDYQSTLQAEYESTDPDLQLHFSTTEATTSFLEKDFQFKLLRAIQACPNGIYRMSPDIEDLVQTSNNVARIHVEDGHYKVLCLTRSSVDSEKWDEANSIKAAMELAGAEVEFSGNYPGWTPKPQSDLVEDLTAVYKELFEGDPLVNACHAGLECGILGTNYPNMEMISFGPNIRGAHSPDEKTQISSVQKFWKFLLETLQRIQ